MKKHMKRAFTIVELVIVIAVIAILAAVLIPTFVNVSKKAKLSNDQSQITQMNLVAAMDQATDPYDYAGDAVISLYNNGWSTAKLSPYSGGYHYGFDFTNYKWYLLDEKGDVVFPEGSVDKADLWVLYNNQSANVVSGVTQYIAIDNVTNDGHYQAGFSSDTSVKYTIDLNGGYISTTLLDNVTVVNGILISGASAGDGVNDGYTLYTLWDSNKGTTESDGTISFEKIIFNGVILPEETNSYRFTDCFFYDSVLYGNSATIGDLTFVNCKFNNNASSYSYAIGTMGNLTVQNCEFTNCQRAINTIVNSTLSDRKIVIENSVFNGTTGENSKTMIQLAYGDATTTVTISGNTFTGLGGADGLIRIHQDLGNAMTSEAKAEQAAENITFLNNTVNSSIDKNKYVIADDKPYNNDVYGNYLVSLLQAKFN